MTDMEMLVTVDAPVDDENKFVFRATVDTSRDWNGWLMPRFTRDEADRIVRDLASSQDGVEPADRINLAWDGDTIVERTYVGTPDECEVRITPDDQGLYSVGEGWCWEEVRRDGTDD